MVEGLDERGDVIFTASAVALGRGELVTNKHAINAGGFLRVRQGTKTWLAHIEKLDEKTDLALLSADNLDAVAAAAIRSTDEIKIGEHVFAVGAPYGLELSLSDGLIAGLRDEEGVTLIQTTAPISKGSSGGGIFDAEGRLVGITTFYLSGAQNLNFAIPAGRISILREQDTEATARAWAGVAVEIVENADSVAGVEPPPCIDLMSASCVDRLNEWEQRMRPHRAAANRERQRAAHAYNAALKLAPSDWAIWVKLGTLYAQLEDREKMEAAFGQALRLRPADISILTTLAESYERLNEHGRAMEVFRGAIRLQRGDANLWVGLARVLRSDRKEAAKALQQAEQLRPSSATVWLSIAMQYQFLNQYSKAETAFREAVHLNPNDALSWALLGNFYASRHNDRKFREVCARLRQIDPEAADNLNRAWR